MTIKPIFRTLITFTGVAFAIVGCVSAFADEDSTQQSATERAALAVEVAAASRGPVTEVVFADGNTKASRREYLLFENAGRVAFLKSNDDGGPLREGDAVKSGELLAELDHLIDNATARVARAELDTVRAALANTRTEFERAKRLQTGNAIQASRFNEIETAFQQALADVRGAEARSDQVQASLRQLQIRAPFGGVVAFVNIREGQFASPEQVDTSSDHSATHASSLAVCRAS